MTIPDVSLVAVAGVAVAGSLAGFFASVDVGTITVAITGVGAALVGLCVVAIKQINAARVDALKAWNEVNKDTLSTQLIRLQEQSAAQSRELLESQQKARDSLHKLNNDANAERLRLQDEIARLTDELHSTREELSAVRVEYRKLMELMRGANRRITDNTDRIATLEQSDSGSGPQAAAVVPRPEGP